MPRGDNQGLVVKQIKVRRRRGGDHSLALPPRIRSHGYDLDIGTPEPCLIGPQTLVMVCSRPPTARTYCTTHRLCLNLQYLVDSHNIPGSYRAQLYTHRSISADIDKRVCQQIAHKLSVHTPYPDASFFPSCWNLSGSVAIRDPSLLETLPTPCI